MAFIDDTGVAFCVLDNADAFQALIDLINTQYGLGLTADDVTALGKSILATEKDFNKRAGFTKEHDRLPEFFQEECAPHNTTWKTETDRRFSSHWRGVAVVDGLTNWSKTRK